MKVHENDPSTYIIISNYDRNSMDIKSEKFNTNTVHVQLEECKLGQATYRGSGLSYQLHDGTVRDNIDFSVGVVMLDNYIQLSFQIEDPEHPNLVEDIANIEGLSNNYD